MKRLVCMIVGHDWTDRDEPADTGSIRVGSTHGGAPHRVCRRCSETQPIAETPSVNDS